MHSSREDGDPSMAIEMVMGAMSTTSRRQPMSPVTQTLDPPSIKRLGWLVVGLTVMEDQVSSLRPQTLGAHMTWVTLSGTLVKGEMSVAEGASSAVQRRSVMTVVGESRRLRCSSRHPGGQASGMFVSSVVGGGSGGGGGAACTAIGVTGSNGEKVTRRAMVRADASTGTISCQASAIVESSNASLAQQSHSISSSRLATVMSRSST